MTHFKTVPSVKWSSIQPHREEITLWAVCRSPSISALCRRAFNPTISKPRLELSLLHCDVQLPARWRSAGPIHESQCSRKARVGLGVGVPAGCGRCLPLNFCSNFVSEEDMSVGKSRYVWPYLGGEALCWWRAARYISCERTYRWNCSLRYGAASLDHPFATFRRTVVPSTSGVCMFKKNTLRGRIELCRWRRYNFS